MKRRGELTLVQQAITNGWNISAKGRDDAIALVSEVLNDPTATAREKLRACRVAIAMADSDLLADEDAVLLDTVKRIGSQLELAARRKP